MKMTDTFYTITETAEGLYKEKGSKFLAFAHFVENEETIKAILDQYKKDYYDARHVCYAYRLGKEGDVFRQNDDGEPSGTAGKPILGQLLSFNVTNLMVVVIRYFGGVKLGVSGLINAYKQAAADALDQADIVEKIVTSSYDLSFEYPLMNVVMRLLKDEHLDTLEQDFQISCRIRTAIRLSDEERIVKRFKQLYGLSVKKVD